MTNQQDQIPSDDRLFKTAELYSAKDFITTFVTLGVSLMIIISLMLTSYYIMSKSFEKTVITNVTMIIALLFGGGLAALFSPLSSREATQFQRITQTLAGVISGFILGKIDAIVSFFREKIPSPTDSPIEVDFLFAAPLACFLIGLISSFVLRAAIISRDENRKDVLRRGVYEQERAAALAAAAH
jgi:archaellum biogenesis protein FlaJ (TadC family)